MISQLIFLFILILLNAYFAATEIAFISLNDAKIEKQAKDGNKKAKQIQKMLKNPSKFLATIQIGITLAGFLSSAFASDAFAGMLAPVLNEWMPFISIATWQNISIVIITIIGTILGLVFGTLLAYYVIGLFNFRFHISLVNYILILIITMFLLFIVNLVMHFKLKN